MNSLVTNQTQNIDYLNKTIEHSSENIRAKTTMTMPLKGIKVLEFAGLAPAPLCGKILADFGAKVTVIDRVSNFIKNTRNKNKFLTKFINLFKNRLLIMILIV